MNIDDLRYGDLTSILAYCRSRFETVGDVSYGEERILRRLAGDHSKFLEGLAALRKEFADRRPGLALRLHRAASPSRRRPDIPVKTPSLIRGRSVAIRLSAAKDPPTEFRLFPLGTVETTKGEFTLDPDDARACLAAQAEYGNDLSIDFGHGAFSEDQGGEPQKAAGWIGGLELRSDGLWAVRVSWTETAAAMISRREQRYYSPAFETKKGHIRKIINCALTLIPASYDLTPLVASRRVGRTVTTRKLNTMAEKYCKASTLAKLADEMDKDEKASDEKKEMSAMLRKLAEDSEELALAEDDDQAETTSDDEPDGDEKSEKQQASRIAKLAREITGKHAPSAVAGVLLAYKEACGKVETLSKQVADLTKGNRSSEVAALISTASRAGKLAPAQKDWATKYGMRDLEGFKAYLETAPVLVSMNDGRPVETPAAQSGASLVKLSDDQRALLRKAGVNVSDEKAVVAFLNRAQGAPAQLPRGSTRHGPHRRPPHR